MKIIVRNIVVGDDNMLFLQGRLLVNILVYGIILRLFRGLKIYESITILEHNIIFENNINNPARNLFQSTAVVD